jgi:Fur family ferric uptake transcriptional regulator
MDTVAELEKAYRSAGRRLTRQRRLVLKALGESDGHLDAESLYDRARVEDPEISLATVYRTLAALKEIGLVEEHRLGGDHFRYEPVGREPHYHFTCRRCGRVIEFETPLVARIREDLTEEKGVSVTSTHLHLSGYCADCRGAAEAGDDEA